MPCFGEAFPPSSSGGRGDSPTARQPGTLHCKLVCFKQDCVVHIIYSTGATRTPNTRQHGRSPYLWGALAEGGPCGWPSLGPSCLPLPRPPASTPLGLCWPSGGPPVGPPWARRPCFGEASRSLACPPCSSLGSSLLPLPLGPPCFGGPSPLVRVVVPVRLFTPPSWLLQVGHPSLEGASGSSPGPVAFRPPPAPDRHSPQAL